MLELSQYFEIFALKSINDYKPQERVVWMAMHVHRGQVRALSLYQAAGSRALLGFGR